MSDELQKLSNGYAKVSTVYRKLFVFWFDNLPDFRLTTIFFFVDGYTANDIRYVWKDENAVGVASETTLNLFELSGHNQKSEYIQVSTGNFCHTMELYSNILVGVH